MKTRKVRTFSKIEGEARAISAHAVLDLESKVKDGKVFTVLLENAERLGKTRVQQMMSYQIRSIFKAKGVTVPDENGNPVAATARVALDTVASDTVKSSMRGATLRSLKLVDAAAVQSEFDPPAGVEVRRREMFLKADVPVGKAIKDFLQGIKPWAREQGFEEMYVEWAREPAKAADAAAMTRATPERAKLNLALEDIGETLFAQKQFVKLAAPLGDHSEDFRDELLNAMVAMLT